MNQEEDTETECQSQVSEPVSEVMGDTLPEAEELKQDIRTANEEENEFMKTKYAKYLEKFKKMKDKRKENNDKVKKNLHKFDNFLETVKKGWYYFNDDTITELSSLADELRFSLDQLSAIHKKETRDEETSVDTHLIASKACVRRIFEDTNSDITLEILQSSPTNIDLLLIGKTGSGKSSTGNSILEKPAFKAEFSIGSVTSETAFDYAQCLGRTINVTDTPGVGFTRCHDEEGKALVRSCIQQAINGNPRGYHAILFVIKFGARLSTEEKEAFDFMKEVFGQDVFKRHGILVLTWGDQFDLRVKSFCSFRDWCKRQDSAFLELLEDFQKRVILFDNVTEDERKKHCQIKSLILMVEQLCSKKYRYTNKQLDEASKEEEKRKIDKTDPN